MLSPLVLTSVSALLYAASFPPLSMAALAWVALVPWLVACGRVQPRRAFALGMLWGVLAAYGVGWWFPAMLHEYFELPPFAGWLGFILVSSLFAGSYFGAFACWVSWMVRRGAVSVGAIAAGWGACELLRAHVVLSNPWALVGYSQTSIAPVVQLADLGGPYAVGLLIASVNAALAGIVAPEWRTSRPWVSRIAVAAVFVGSLTYGAWRLSESFDDGGAAEVAIIQGAIERGHAWRPEYWSQGLARYLEMTTQANAAQPDLVVWPEHAVNFYIQEGSPEQLSLLMASKAMSGDLIFGGPRYELSMDRTRYFNSVFLAQGGRLTATYDKRRLLPIAESRLFGRFGDPRIEYFPGMPSPAFRTRIGRIAPLVCVEGDYPEYVRAAVRRGADLLVVLSNDAWFRYAAPARHQLDMSAMRAVENRRYLVRAASTGISAVIDPHGRILTESPFGAPAILRATVHRSSAQSPYERWGDLPNVLAVFVIVTVSTWRARRLAKR